MKQIIVKGHVHGVFFRANTKKIAKRLGLVGYVKNLEDRSVEIIVKGEENKIKELIEWCKKGPFLAKVNSVVVKDIKDNTKEQKFDDFEVMY